MDLITKILKPLNGGKTIGAGIILIILSSLSQYSEIPMPENLVNGIIGLMFITSRMGMKNGK